MSTKRMFSNTVIVALSLIVSVTIFSSCGSAVDKLIELTAQQGNKNCPISISSDLRMDSIGSPASKTLAYYYTLINAEKETYEPEVDMDQMKEVMIEAVKNLSELDQLKKLDVIFEYVYFDKNGQKIFVIDITPKDYK